MASSNSSLLPTLNAEHRRVATAQFERANQVVATGNYDYGIRLLLSCCKLDPANLIYRQALRRTEKAKYRNNLRGSWFSRLLSWPARARLRAALRGREYLKVLEYGERILTGNPWDVGAQMDMAQAADVLGLLDLAVWSLEQARQNQGLDAHLNRSLARLYEKRGNFTQAIALWELVHRVRPQDVEAQTKIKNLAADDTIARGQWTSVVQSEEGEEAAEEVADTIPHTPTAREAPALKTGSSAKMPALKDSSGKMPALKDGSGKMPALQGSGKMPVVPERVLREAAPLRKRLEEDPTNAGIYLQLAALYRRNNDLEHAQAALREGLGATGNAFELAVELADVEIESFRRNLAIAEERLRTNPNDPQLKTLQARLHKEINSRELELFRQKAARYPTEMSHRYEVGVRLFRAGQIDEAIKDLQAARADPQHRWQSLIALGRCFKMRNNWRLAQRNFEEALRYLPAGEKEIRKDVLFELAVGQAQAGDLPRAIDLANELANIDFTYRDIGQKLDEWQTTLQQARVSR